jgi:hypothetical protein
MDMSDLASWGDVVLPWSGKSASAPNKVYRAFVPARRFLLYSHALTAWGVQLDQVAAITDTYPTVEEASDPAALQVETLVSARWFATSFPCPPNPDDILHLLHDLFAKQWKKVYVCYTISLSELLHTWKNNLDAALAASRGEPAPGSYYETPQSSVALRIGLSRLRMVLRRLLDRKVLSKQTK